MMRIEEIVAQDLQLARNKAKIMPLGGGRPKRKLAEMGLSYPEAKAPSETLMQDPEARILVEYWCCGTLPAKLVQEIAAASVAGDEAMGRGGRKAMKILKSLGTDGKWLHNAARDLERKCNLHNPVLPEATLVWTKVWNAKAKLLWTRS